MAQAYVYEDDVTGWRHIQSGDIPSGGGSPLTTKGDLYGFDTANNRIPVGANNTVLTADSTQALGVKWGTAGTISSITSTGGTITVGSPSGPTTNVDLPNSGVTAGTYGDSSHVARVTVSADGVVTGASSIGISGVAGSGLTQLFDSTLGADTANIDTGVSGIASGHSHLIVFIYARTAVAGTDVGVNVTVNNDSSAIYDLQEGLITNTAVSGINLQAQTSWGLDCIGTNASDSYASTIILHIPAYDQTSWWKSGTYQFAGPYSQSTAVHSAFGGIGYRATTAISRMKLAGTGGNLKAGSRLTIYGTQ